MSHMVSNVSKRTFTFSAALRGRPARRGDYGRGAAVHVAHLIVSIDHSVSIDVSLLDLATKPLYAIIVG